MTFSTLSPEVVYNKMLGSLIGGIVADAYGATYEFRPRDSFSVSTELEYVSTFNLPAGSFTDDSSMMLCLAESLTECGGFNAQNQMGKYAKWRREGYMSSAPERGCFDTGRTTSMAIGRYEFDLRQENEIDMSSYGLTGESDSGNGGIMRLSPVPIFYWRDADEAVKYAKESSSVTHASLECLDCAALMAHVIVKLLKGATKDVALKNGAFEGQVQSAKVKAMCRGEYKLKKRDDILTTGYVVHSLEAALWALWTEDDYQHGVMTLAQMGMDTDTVCCIYGQMAGALYGYNSLPKSWVDALQKKELVAKVCVGLIVSVL